MQFNYRKQNNPIKNQTKDLSRHFSKKKDRHVANKHIKRGSASLTLRRCKSNHSEDCKYDSSGSKPQAQDSMPSTTHTHTHTQRIITKNPTTKQKLHNEIPLQTRGCLLLKK
jgi:hypothetical protein